MRKSVFDRLLRRFSTRPCADFSYKAADSYHLPEGRYYDVPFALKSRRRKKNTALPVFLGLGFSFLSVSAIVQKPPAAVPANATILAGRPAAFSPRNIDAEEIAGDSAAGNISGRRAGHYRRGILPNAAAAEPQAQMASSRPQREDIFSRADKSGSVLRARNSRPRLVNYDTHYAALGHDYAVNISAAALKDGGKEAYAVRFMPPRSGKAAETAKGFVPAPVRQKPPSLPVPQMLAALVNNDKPDILALGYAAVPQDRLRESPFDSILTDNAKQPDDGRFIPPIGKKDHPWAAAPLPAASFTPKEQKCLAEAVYFEARSESLRGQAAIAQVVLNRVRNPAYPNTICNVVYQNIHWYNRCQFSFACDGRKHYVTELRPWHAAQAVAKAVSAGQIWLADVGSSTHYHADYVRPHWALLMDKMQKIGRHIFYRTKGGGWS